MSEEKAPEVQFLRKRDSRFVYHSTKILLERGDLFPCDAEGNFLTTGTKNLEPAIDTDAPAPANTNDDDTDNDVVIAMLERASELGIKNAHRMKEETLAARIADAEKALTDANKNGE